MQQLIASQVRLTLDPTAAFKQSLDAYRDQPVFKDLLGVQTRPTPHAEADRGLHVRIQEVDKLYAGVQPQIQLGKFLLKAREARQQPLLQEGGQPGDR